MQFVERVAMVIGKLSPFMGANYCLSLSDRAFYKYAFNFECYEMHYVNLKCIADQDTQRFP